MKWLKQLVAFLKGLGRKPKFEPGEVETSDEVVLETELKRGVRGM